MGEKVTGGELVVSVGQEINGVKVSVRLSMPLPPSCTCPASCTAECMPSDTACVHRAKATQRLREAGQQLLLQGHDAVLESQAEWASDSLLQEVKARRA